MRYKTLTYIFILSFALNLVWENIHSTLYVHYKGGPITEWILIQATFVDALIITSVASVFLYVQTLKKHLWISVGLWICIALGIEWFALGTDRWAYTSAMPILPVINTGLTPTIQLALLGYISVRVAKKLTEKNN